MLCVLSFSVIIVIPLSINPLVVINCSFLYPGCFFLSFLAAQIAEQCQAGLFIKLHSFSYPDHAEYPYDREESTRYPNDRHQVVVAVI